MNTGQMLITIGAIFLLTMVILTTNRGLINTNATMIDNRYGILATSLATSMIEKATGKAFDHNSDTTAITSTNSLTNVTSLGIETGENRNNPEDFNDFDDFNCYISNPKLDTVFFAGTERRIIFSTFCRVDYITTSNPNSATNQRTWHKRMIVRVISPEMVDTIKLSTIYSYWYFR
jgi:MSHA pilin protein MshD